MSTLLPNQMLLESRFQELKAREQAAFKAALDLIAAPKRYAELDDTEYRTVMDRLGCYLDDRASMPADVRAALDKQWDDGETALSFSRTHTARRPPQLNAQVLAQEDDDALWLQIELANDCAITIRAGKSGEPPSVAIWRGSGEHILETDQAEHFAEWLRLALAGATPYEACHWGGEGIELRRHCT
jgi:hypothetical protein